MIDNASQFIAPWWQWMTQVSLQVIAVFTVVALLDRLLSRWVWPQLLRVLWLVVVLKLLVPPTLTSPVSVSHVVPSHVAEWSPSSAAPTTDSATLPLAAVVIWIVGVVVLSAWTALRYRAQKRTLLQDAAAPPAWVAAVARQQAERLGLKRLPSIRITPLRVGPAVVGVRHATVVLPLSLIEDGRRQHVEHVLLHEFAHVLRRDPLVSALLSAVQLLYWFHPVAWVARRRLDTLCEICCDQTVRRAVAGETPAYRRTLLHFARPLLGPHGAGVLPFIHPQARIIARLRWLDRPMPGASWLRNSLSTLTAGALTICVVPLARPTSTQPVTPQPTAAVSPAARPPGCLQLRYQVFRAMAEQDASAPKPENIS